ncbi:TetR/AcrR family transcriptional regulator C-terminal domain-containing protein [Streptomyces sp. NPDC048506]|uniref:TetR/AcrR family transcriptional regulator C-terminal domain-containing protein n=1 Tax=Streptomyces sp. NPDC048506 TaxID=3155028 RepID=UPI00343AA8F8
MEQVEQVEQVEQSIPPYRRIVEEIRRRIDAGELAPGDRVPSTRRITQEWGVAMATATKVLTTLRQEGLVRAVPGVGTVVAEPEPHPQAPPPRAARGEAAGERRPREADSGLSRDRVVRAAVKVADAEGLRALSMRRVAAEFGVSSMALYRHVANKDELVLLMADAVFEEIELPEPAPEGWRDRMAAGARLQWELYHRHPWLAQYLSLTRPRPMPRAMALIEWTMARVTGMDPLTLIHMALTLLSFVLSTAAGLEEDLEAEQETGLDQSQWMAAMEPTFEGILSSGSYPMYAEMSGTEEGLLNLDTLFEFGLARILDGMEVLVERRAAEGGTPSETPSGTPNGTRRG